MNKHQFKDFTILVFDDSNFKEASRDVRFNYKKQYFNSDNQYYTCSHGVKVMQMDELFSSCILLGTGGSTTVFGNSTLCCNEQVLVCCGNTVFCLSLPELDLKWKTEADWATCFQVFEYKNDFIVHGETEISRLSSSGEVRWTFSAADIFVSIDNQKEFEMLEDGIELCDFENNRYKIDYDGNLLWDSIARNK